MAERRCNLVRGRSGLKRDQMRLRGTNLGDAATDREDGIATGQRSGNGPNGSRACALVRRLDPALASRSNRSA